MRIPACVSKQEDLVYGGILGLCVADALGVPVEFESRETLAQDPVTGMRSGGSHEQPAGTWSDDTSMTLCLLDSLIGGLDYTDMCEKFWSWFNKAAYTAHDEVFDMGHATRKALQRFAMGDEPLQCGGQSVHDNGNGSLMRILPLAFYLCMVDRGQTDDEFFACVHEVSSLTHAHLRSRMACGIYLSVARGILLGDGHVQSGLAEAAEYYGGKAEYAEERPTFHRLFDEDFANLPQAEIRSSGYVVDTLEAALWCIMNTSDYASCVLMAVNLGEDTDTVAAVAGGLAGMMYGVQAIPEDWLRQIARLDYIVERCDCFLRSLTKSAAQALCAYIPYFETVDPAKACKRIAPEGTYSLHQNYVYDEKLLQFAADFRRNRVLFADDFGLRMISLRDGCRADSGVDMVQAIAQAGEADVKAILTSFIGAEDVCEGAWAVAVECGIFLALLRRLQVLPTVAEVQAALRNPAALYRQPFVNYRGSVGGERYTEIAAREIAKCIKPDASPLLPGIPKIVREASYKTRAHQEIGANERPKHSNRDEEWIAKEMCSKVFAHIGKVIDFQTPLKNISSDEAGKIDLLSYNKDENIAYILELKKPDSDETLLRCALEAYTYWETVDRSKLLRDFCIEGAELRKAVLVFRSCAACKDFRDTQCQEVRALMRDKLGVDFFVLRDDADDVLNENQL